MQLSLHADYSCRVLIYLATMDAELASIEQIARAYQISRNHLVKVVHQLGKLGYVETTRGRGGGIKLARPASEIRIGEVVRQTEQPNFALIECFDRVTNSCPIIGSCGLKPWLAKALQAFLATLDDVTVADVVAKRPQIARSLRSKRSSAIDEAP